MKEKLQKIKEGLEFYSSPSDYKAPFTGGLGKLYYDCGVTAKEALAHIDSIIAELDSAELVDKVAGFPNNSNITHYDTTDLLSKTSNIMRKANV